MRFLTADKLFNGRQYLPEGQVLVLDHQNLLKEVVSADAVDQTQIEKLEGVITPGFVNAHCHLELSHLEGKIARHTGLPAFARQVVSLRNAVDKTEISVKMQQANLDMWNKGIVAVGDISNSEDSFQEKLNSKIYYHTFIELIGLNPAVHKTIFDKGLEILLQLNKVGLPGSLAPHAPYSTSKELIQSIASHNSNNKLSLSIHNQESEEEHKFFHGQKNGFDELYRSLGLDLSWYQAPRTSSLLHYQAALGISPSILVHNTFTNASELEVVKNKNIYWCFCPGANLYIEDRLPDFSVFAGSKNRVVIGTDSLASNSGLDVITEANLILAASKVFSPEELLRSITLNGAESLGITDSFGSFIPGKNAGLNLVSLNHPKINFLKKIA